MVTAPAFIGGIGGQEILFALAIALILFGPKRLPEFARKIAQVSHKLREANRQIKRELYSNLDPEEIMRDRPQAPPPPRPRPAAHNVEQGEAGADGEAASDPVVEGEEGELSVSSEQASEAGDSAETSREVLDDLDAGVDYDAPYRDAEAATELRGDPDEKTDPGKPGSVE